MTNSQDELREAQARIAELEKQNRKLELKSKLYNQERKMLSANVAVGVVEAFRATTRKEDVKVREALEEAVVDWLEKHDALDAIDLKAGVHNKVADDKVDEEAEDVELGTVAVRDARVIYEGDADEDDETVELEDEAVDEPSATLPMPRPDYNL